METRDNKLPRQLSPADIAATMQEVRKAAYACFTSYGVAGDALVRFTIAKSGKVQKVTLGGSFLGTPTGDCVVKTVVGAEFDEFDGPDMNLSYPFQLR